MMIRYAEDPRWLSARFASKCQCGRQIKHRDRIYYFPRTKTALCETCGEPAHARFLNEAQDEAVISGQGK